MLIIQEPFSLVEEIPSRVFYCVLIVQSSFTYVVDLVSDTTW